MSLEKYLSNILGKERLTFDAFVKSIDTLMTQVGGIADSTFFTCSIDNIRFLAKMNIYRKVYYGNVAAHIDMEKQHPIDCEAEILKLIKTHILDNNLSPCFVEFYHQEILDNLLTDHSMEVCNQLEISRNNLPPKKKYLLARIMCGYVNDIHIDEAINRISLTLMEKCTWTFIKFIEKTITDTMNSVEVIRSMLFMIIHALYTITTLFPSFKHNDLHSENVMIFFDTMFVQSTPKYQQLCTQYGDFYVPYFGFTPKIIDFNISEIKEIGISSQLADAWAMPRSNELIFIMRAIHREAYRMISNHHFGDVINKMLTELDPSMAWMSLSTNPFHIDVSPPPVPTPSYVDMMLNPMWHDYMVPVDVKQIHAIYDDCTLIKK